jgi:hypothetical protein
MRDVLETLAKLPTMCAARHPSDKSVILIARGVMGYWPAPASIVDPDQFNERHGITAAQVDAMVIGSMFGWDVPGVEHALLRHEGEPTEAEEQSDDRLKN